MADVGYIRVSSVEQNSGRQLDGVKIDKIFEDRCSGANTNRPQLELLKQYVREGDVVHVHDISRMARNLEDLLSLVKDFNQRGVAVHFHKESLFFSGESNPMQELMLSLLGAVYQFERSMILERQREGIAKAKLAGKYKGRSSKIDKSEIKKALLEGKSIRKIASALNVGVSTVQRVKAEM